MADLTRYDVTKAGRADIEAVIAAAAAGGDAVPNDDDTLIIVQNGGGSSITLTIPKQKSEVTVPGFGTFTVADITLAIAAGDIGLVAAPKAAYNNADGKAILNYSAVTSVKAGAVRRVA